MEETLINKINKELFNKGIGNQSISMGYKCEYVPNSIKELVVYSCSSEYGIKNHMVILDMIIDEICPNISYNNYKEIKSLIETDIEKEYGYYGDSDEYLCSYIILSKLEKLIENF